MRHREAKQPLPGHTAEFESLQKCGQKSWSTQPHTSKSFWHKPQDISELGLSWSNKGNLICGKSVWRDISSDSFAVIQSGQLDAFSLFSGGVTQLRMKWDIYKKNSLKVCELMGEAAWTLPLPAPRGWQWGLHREVGTGSPSLGTGWLERRYNPDIWRSPDEPAGSPGDEPCLPMSQDSHELLEAFWYLPLSSTYIFLLWKM